MFQGTLPHKAINIIGNIVKEWNVDRVFIGCSGNFTIERSISSLLNCKITSNDVTIYSSNIGKYFSGQPLDELRIKDEYDKYLDTLNEVSKGSRIKNTAVGFMAMLEIVKNHMEELKEVWIDDAKDKEYVPISTIIGRSDIKAKNGRVLDKAVQLLIDKGEIKKVDKEDALVVLAEKYLESEGRLKKEKGKK